MRDKAALAKRDEWTFSTISTHGKATRRELVKLLPRLSKGSLDHSLRRLKRAGRIYCSDGVWTVQPQPQTTIAEVQKLAQPPIE